MADDAPASGWLAHAREVFAARFGRWPAVAYRAPGRVNLIGEHTDYSGGLVLPVAIDRAVLVLAAPSPSRRLRLFSMAYSEMAELGLEVGESVLTSGAWPRRVLGLIAVLCEAGYPVQGCDALVAGDLPIGAGLASSAAFTVAVAGALLRVAGREALAGELAPLCHRAEQRASGVQCGIMDQFATTLARRGRALLIDCRTQLVEHLPLDEQQVRIVVADSGVGRSLVSVGYNTRRRELEVALARLADAGQPVSARDITPDQVAGLAALLPRRLGQRLRHVVEENARVAASAEALRRGELRVVGQLMLASHASLRDLYEVSTPELETLVECAAAAPGCLGAKLTGAGFGGATINLVEADQVESFCRAVAEQYHHRTGRQARLFACRTADGASPWPVELDL